MPDGSVEKDLSKWRREESTCRWWQRHKWSKWSHTSGYNFLGMRVDGQVKTCLRCGFTKTKTL